MPMSGSETARNGFRNEQEIADKFNNWKNDSDARQWLAIMMYDLSERQYHIAEKGRRQWCGIRKHASVQGKSDDIVLVFIHFFINHFFRTDFKK